MKIEIKRKQSGKQENKGKKKKLQQPTTHRTTQQTLNLECFLRRVLTSSPAFSNTTQSHKVCAGSNHWPSGLNQSAIVSPKPQSELYCQKLGWTKGLSLWQLKAFGQWPAVFVTLVQTHRSYSLVNNDRIHLRWPCCEQFQGNGAAAFSVELWRVKKLVLKLQLCVFVAFMFGRHLAF